MRLILTAVLTATVLIAGCSQPSSPQAPAAAGCSAPRSVTETEAIAGVWRAVDATPLVGLDFSSDGVVKQQLSRNGQVFEMRGSWRVSSPGRIFTSEIRAGVPNVRDVYEYRIEGDRLTLSWVQEEDQPGRQPSEPVPWLAGTNHPVITLIR